jgi:hypothetical protein
MGNHVLLSGNDHPDPKTTNAREAQASSCAGAYPPTWTILHAPIGTLRNSTPLLIRVRKSPQYLVERVDCLRPHLWCHKPWIYILTTATLSHYLMISYRRRPRLRSVRTPHATASFAPVVPGSRGDCDGKGVSSTNLPNLSRALVMLGRLTTRSES